MTNVLGTKVVVGVIYGGRSSEHEVSLRSAASVFRRLDRNRYDVRTLYIDKEGHWHWTEIPGSFIQSDAHSLPIATNAPEVVLLPRPYYGPNGTSQAVFAFLDPAQNGRREKIDVLIPMVHGKNCEDGTLQGLFESAEVAYTGSGILGSSVGMDKEVAKRLAEKAGIPVVPYLVARSWDSDETLRGLVADAKTKLGFPVFVKAAREGSSVGVYKVKSESELLSKIREAFTFDNKVLIEKGVAAREIEFSVMENEDRSQAPIVSIPAEIIPTHEFYTYDAKYNDENGAIFKIPAEISSELKTKLGDIARKAFVALELEGYARVDLFLDKNTNEYYLNEVNTLPGFTSISMFPKLMEMTGLPYTELLTKLIGLAQRRSKKK